MSALRLASLLSPFFFELAPEVRSTYQSLGKIVEDRPMQVTSARVGIDAGEFGRFGIRNWDVSSLTDRRDDVHRHALYHTEFGPTWQFGFELAEEWKVTGDLTRSWTLYRGVSSVSFRLEAGWCFSATVSAFVFVEQYGIVGGDERRANSADAYRCAHDDWTHGGMGLRLRF